MNRMIRLSLFFILLGINLYGGNLVKNGSLDRWENGLPRGWQGRDVFKTDRKDIYQGVFDGSAAILKPEKEGKIAYLKYKGIKLKPGKKYRLEFFHCFPRSDSIWGSVSIIGKTRSLRFPITRGYYGRKWEEIIFTALPGMEEVTLRFNYRNKGFGWMMIDEVSLTELEGNYTGIKFLEGKGNRVIARFMVVNSKPETRIVSLRYALYSYFGNLMKEGKWEGELREGEEKTIDVPFQKGREKYYRAELRVRFGRGREREIARYFVSDITEGFHRRLSLTREEWEMQALKRGEDLSPGKWRKVRLPSYAPGPSGHPVYNTIEKILQDPKDWVIWYRRKVRIPPHEKGERIILDFPTVALSPEVYIDGVKIEGTPEGREPFYLDITQEVEGKKEFELAIKILGLKNAVKKMGENFLIVLPYTHTAGIINPVYLEIVPGIYVEEVYAETKVREKRITVHALLRNKTSVSRLIKVSALVQGMKGDNFTLPEKEVYLPGGKSYWVKIDSSWENPHLWFPHDPYLYKLTVRLSNSKGEIIDEKYERFGFREVWREGPYIMFNGKKLKTASLLSIPHPMVGRNLWKHRRGDTWYMLKDYKKFGFLMARAYSIGREFEPEVADEVGFLLRYSFELNMCATNKNQFYPMDNKYWGMLARHVESIIRRNRNHPSILTWDFENESFLCGLEDHQPGMAERFYRLHQIARAWDSTRLLEHDGGGRQPLNDNDVINLHYPFLADKRWLTAESFPIPDFRPGVPEKLSIYPGRLLWNRDRPIIYGESSAPGMSEVPGSFTILVDDWVYRGLYTSRDTFAFERGMTEILKIKHRMSRLAEVSGITVWGYGIPSALDSLQPNAVFLLEYDREFFSSQRIKRTVVIHHDVLYDEDCLFQWELKDEKGKTIEKGEERRFLSAGDIWKYNLRIKMPRVREKENLTLSLKLLAGGRILAQREEKFRVYPRKRIRIRGERKIYLYDPVGISGKVLKRERVSFSSLSKLSPPPEEGSLLIIGKNALKGKRFLKEGKSLREFVKRGGRILVFEQEGEHLRGFPLGLTTDGWLSSPVAHPRAIDHPILKNMEAENFQFWAPDGFVSRANYYKPDQGNFLPILDTGKTGGLWTTPLLEIFEGKGSWLFCQLRVTERASTVPGARNLLENLLQYASGKDNYRIMGEKPLLLAEEGSKLRRALETLGIEYQENAPDDFAGKVMIVDGSRILPQERIEKIISRVREGKTLWLWGINEETQEEWRKFIKGLKVKKFEDSRCARYRFDPLISGLSATELYWLGVNTVIRVIGESFQEQRMGSIVTHKVEVEGGERLLEYGALTKIPLGKGVILLDTLGWVEGIDNSPERARKIGSIIATNLGIPVREWIQDKPIPPSQLEFSPLPLEKFYNEDILPHFPAGKVSFADIPFDLGNLEKRAILLGTERLTTRVEPRLPLRVRDIPVGRRADLIYFLITVFDPFESGVGYGTGEDLFLAEINYEGGEKEIFRFKHKIHAANLWEDFGNLQRGKVVWKGPTPFKNWLDDYTIWQGRWIQRENPNRVYLTSWRNPHPEKKIKSIGLLSLNKHFLPVVFGITTARRKE